MDSPPTGIMIGWTTAPDEATARTLAEGLVAARLAACAQVSGPIASFYSWDGALERAAEYRLSVKFPASRAAEIEAWLAAHHPYDTPQWLACHAAAVSGKYLKWVLDTST
jgi:periplasmic divalent cation tolerance protein